MGRSHYDGQCLDGSSNRTVISTTTLGHNTGTDVDCNSNCNADSSCTAFSFSYSGVTCILYSGGPYTSGNGASATRCFQRETGNVIHEANTAIKEINLVG